MSHFAFVCPPLLGHINPMRALAEALVSRGHAATFFGIADARTSIGDGPSAFVAVGPDTHPAGSLQRITARLADPRGLKLVRILRDTARLTDMLCRELPDTVRAHRIDAVVSDQLEPAGGLVAAHLGVPWVSVANALLINRDEAIPPPFVGWRFDPSDAGRTRNRGGYRVADFIMAGTGRIIARHAARFGLPLHRRMEDCLSPFAEISQTVPAFDFPRNRPMPLMHSCGPLRPAAETADVSPLLHATKPLVFASLGTLQGGRVDVFARIAEACHALGLHLVIAHGGRLSEPDAAALPGWPIVRAFLPQRALLRHAALAITNGGLNTVLDALAAAVPVIAIPIAFEQAAIAARLTYRNVGSSMPLRRLTAARLQAEIGRALHSDSVRRETQTIARAIAQAGGVERAAAVVEAVAGRRHPVAAAEWEHRP